MSKNILHSSETNQWYTPAKYMASVKQVLGDIDLDPASCKLANDLCVGAKKYFTIEDDGLAQDWFGRVYMNCPYGKGYKNKSNQDIWTAKLIKEYKQGNVDEAICLVNAATAQKWFQKLWPFPICFVTPRIKFVDEFGDEAGSPGHGNAFVYIGKKNINKFYTEFSQYGNVVIPYALQPGVKDD